MSNNMTFDSNALKRGSHVQTCTNLVAFRIVSQEDLQFHNVEWCTSGRTELIETATEVDDADVSNQREKAVRTWTLSIVSCTANKLMMLTDNF